MREQRAGMTRRKLCFLRKERLVRYHRKVMRLPLNKRRMYASELYAMPKMDRSGRSDATRACTDPFSRSSHCGRRCGRYCSEQMCIYVFKSEGRRASRLTIRLNVSRRVILPLPRLPSKLSRHLPGPLILLPFTHRTLPPAKLDLPPRLAALRVEIEKPPPSDPPVDGQLEEVLPIPERPVRQDEGERVEGFDEEGAGGGRGVVGGVRLEGELGEDALSCCWLGLLGEGGEVRGRGERGEAVGRESPAVEVHLRHTGREGEKEGKGACRRCRERPRESKDTAILFACVADQCSSIRAKGVTLT
jgi:hypothetical protein